MTVTETPAVPTGYASRKARRSGGRPDVKDLIASWVAPMTPETNRKFRKWVGAYVQFLDQLAKVDNPEATLHPADAEAEDFDQFMQTLASVHYDDHPGECMRGVCDYMPITTIQRKDARIAVRLFYDFLVERRVADYQIVPRLRGRRGTGNKAHDKEFFLPEELGRIMQCAQESSPQDALICGLFIGTGMRPAEQHLLNVDQFGRNQYARTLKFLRVKKGEEPYWQTISLGSLLSPIIDAWTDGRTSGPLIISTGRRTRNPETNLLEHTRLDPSGVRRRVQRICADAGVHSEANPYMFRDTYGTLNVTLTSPWEKPGEKDAEGKQLVRPARTSLARIKVAMAHKHVNTTMIYYNEHGLARRGAIGHQVIRWCHDWRIGL
jgi:integrase